MLRSTRLVAITGVLLGLSVTLLPLGTHAVTITQDEVAVSAKINGVLSFTAVSHNAVGTPDSSYTSSNNTYTGTFEAASYSENFANTTYQVTCNFLTYTDTQTSQSVRGCENGWNVTATAGSYNATSHEAQMTPEGAPANAATIKSIKANNLNGSNSNWLIKITGDTRTYNDGSTVHPAGATYTDSNSIARDYTDFEAIPYSNSTDKRVVTGNTFTSVSGAPTTYTYKGYQEFVVTYGFSAGAATPADTYTGTVTYTLSINAAS